MAKCKISTTRLSKLLIGTSVDRCLVHGGRHAVSRIGQPDPAADGATTTAVWIRLKATYERKEKLEVGLLLLLLL